MFRWLNKEFGDLTSVVKDDKTYYVDKDRKPLIYYYHNKKNMYVYVNYDRIWGILESIFGMEELETEDILIIWLEETYNLRGATSVGTFKNTHRWGDL